MSWFHAMLSAGSRYFVVGIVGDSNAAGRGGSAGPTALAGSCYEYTGGVLVELTTADISTTSGTYGSFAKQFAINHYARTGQSVVFVASGVPSASFAFTGDTNNWMPSPTGVNYDNFTTDMDACLAYLGKPRPDLIIGSLGINDVTAGTGAVSNAQFEAAVDSLFDRLDTDYPGVQKLWIQIGRTTTETNSVNLYDKRRILVEQVESHAQHAMCGQGFAYVFNSGYEADLIHYNNNSLNAAGAGFDRFVALSNIANKWARGYISSLYTLQTAPVQAAMVDLITTAYNAGEYFNWEGLMFMGDDVRNVPVDMAFMASSTLVGATFSANNYIRLDGIDDYWASSFVPTYWDRATSTDVIIGCKVLTNRDNIGTTAASLFQVRNAGGDHISLQQSGASALIYRVSDQTVSSSATVPFFANDTFYSAERIGTTKGFNEGSTLIASVSVAVTAVPAAAIPFGCQNINGTLGNFLDADLQVIFAGRRQGITLATLITKIEAVIDAY